MMPCDSYALQYFWRRRVLAWQIINNNNNRKGRKNQLVDREEKKKKSSWFGKSEEEANIQFLQKGRRLTNMHIHFVVENWRVAREYCPPPLSRKASKIRPHFHAHQPHTLTSHFKSQSWARGEKQFVSEVPLDIWLFLDLVPVAEICVR